MAKFFVISGVLLALGGGGFWYYQKVYLPASAKPAPPPTVEVKRGLIRLAVGATGKVVSNLDVDIKCKASGEVLKLPFDVSDAVKKDALLVELDPIDMQRMVKQSQTSLEASKAKLASAGKNLEVSQRNVDTERALAQAALTAAEAHAVDADAKAKRVKELMDKKLSSQEEYETSLTAAVQSASDRDNAKAKMEDIKTQEIALELRRQDVALAQAQVDGDQVALDIAQDRLRDTKVQAPMDGVVTARTVQEGTIISSGVSNVGGGTTILTLSDLSKLFVLASIDESEIGKVKVAQKVSITADAFPGKRFKGAVVRITPRGVTVTNVVTFEVKIEVTSEDKSLLMPEMTANVEIIVNSKDNVVQVPVEAISYKDRKQPQVTLAGKDGAPGQAVPVEIGISDGSLVEIVKGVEEGQTIEVRKGAADSKWTAGQKPTQPPRGMMMPGGPRR